MFANLLGKRTVTASAQQTASTGIAYTADAAVFAAPGCTAHDWLSNPYKFSERADQGARLQQIRSVGLGHDNGSTFVLPWDAVYEALRRPEFESYRDALALPPDSNARPKLTSRGALMDADFAVFLDGWVDPHGKPLQPVPKVLGRVIEADGRQELLSHDVHLLLVEVERFHATPPVERSASFKEAAFGRIRRVAMACGSPVSNYVARTIVLTPDTLKLSLRRHGEDTGKVIEVIPGFDEAPERWLAQFDRLPLQDRYDVPDGASLVRVVVTPAVRSVLAEIKRMPGRRSAGARAEAFVRNPFALLGSTAQEVIDTDAFEGELERAGIVFHRFTPQVERGASGEVTRVGLLVDGAAKAAGAASVLWIDSADELSQFLGKLGRSIDDASQCFTWQRQELEVDGDCARHWELLQTWLRQWRGAALWTSAEIFDLSKYSERIEAIGIEKAVLIPVIVRNDEENGWFEDNVTIGVKLEVHDGAQDSLLPLTFSDIRSLQHAVEAAKAAMQSDILLPGLASPVPIEDAIRAVDALLAAQRKLEGKEKGTGGSLEPEPKQRLVVKSNVDEIHYSEGHGAALELPEGRQPRMPAGLLPKVRLKDHQRVGVAWLQHLWDASPQRCRGTILADDMGLGKTLQLLTFMACAFEADPSLPPALVVAPVALLENWRNELNRFFAPETLPLLLLYGDALRALRVSKSEVDDDLRSQGITRLLKKNWLGQAKLVLTTYETMRDLEFALASQHWSIMVCDEAQKIKNPAAMVTRSAKKQKVRFRIACTGTPVENTLADLWCLFDFVQPGMLGALSHFSRTYRQPIETKTDDEKAKVEELRALIKPQILHRKKSEVAKDLPAPQFHAGCKRLAMSSYQQGLYAGALNTLAEQRATNPSAQLQALMAIRKICSDPHGFAEPTTRKISVERLVNESPKMGWMIDLLKKLAADRVGNHKVIVFCEFRELQLSLQRVTAAFFAICPSIVNGETSADPEAPDNRQALIDEFQRKPGFNIIILSPVAVGFGVNIQAANHVIHFTRTWNPAKEDQATARAHRIGQARTVTVYYPGVVSKDFPSFDVRLDALLERKRALAADMLNGSGDLKADDFADFG